MLMAYLKEYNSGMKSSLCCALLFASGLSAQSTAALESDLSALAVPGASVIAVANRLTDDILALSEKDAQPSRQTVFDFSIELGKALTGKASTQSKLQSASSAILDVLQSSGTPSARFHAAIDRFRNALTSLNATAVTAQDAANRLMILGQEVRGPDGIEFK